MLALLGHSSWIYQEGRNRNDMYALETSAKFLDVDYDLGRLATDLDRIAYVRGYFDAEGGMPRLIDVRPFQIQLVQKDQNELGGVRDILTKLGIKCGRMHNPSRSVDPDYWRFYISAASVADFARVIGSWHPRKEQLLGMMI
jgi:hypothetical protein